MPTMEVRILGGMDLIILCFHHVMSPCLLFMEHKPLNCNYKKPLNLFTRCKNVLGMVSAVEQNRWQIASFEGLGSSSVPTLSFKYFSNQLSNFPASAENEDNRVIDINVTILLCQFYVQSFFTLLHSRHFRMC